MNLIPKKNRKKYPSEMIAKLKMFPNFYKFVNNLWKSIILKN